MPQDTYPAALPGAASAPGGSSPPTAPLPPAITNRLRALLLHIPWYSIQGPARLAEDIGVARSTVSRLMRQKSNPSYSFVVAVTRALSYRSGIPLDMRDVFATDGTYPTASVCDLLDCTGCFPPEAWDERTDSLRPEWEEKIPGDWCRYPNESPAAGSLS